MEFISNLLPFIINGLSLGLLFALIALGFMLIVGVMELINLAHGLLFALGAYVQWFNRTPCGMGRFHRPVVCRTSRGRALLVAP